MATLVEFRLTSTNFARLDRGRILFLVLASRSDAPSGDPPRLKARKEEFWSLKMKGSKCGQVC